MAGPLQDCRDYRGGTEGGEAKTAPISQILGTRRRFVKKHHGNSACPSQTMFIPVVAVCAVLPLLSSASVRLALSQMFVIV